MAKAKAIKARERDAIVQALRAGVVPRIGLHHVQVGRAAEIKEIIKDIERIGGGGSAIRFIIGEYGSGKTFFLHLVRLVALEKKLAVMHADLAPDRRLHATGGQARSLFNELTRNLSTRSRLDGGATKSIVERFITDSAQQGESNGRPVQEVIHDRLHALSELVSGFDFADVLNAYWEAHQSHDDARQEAALRWLRGEFGTKTESRAALGVRSIIDDGDVYDYLKLYAQFVRMAGYQGLLICIDELVNLYKLQSAKARQQNYEQILRILNDVLQGSVTGLGFLLGGTPEFLLDTRRGLYSYEALESRLSQNTFVRDGLVDLSGPIINLQNLSPEDLYVLLRNLRRVFASGDPAKELVPDEALEAFMQHCNDRIGDSYFRTPRSSIKAFLDLLLILEQNPQADWRELLSSVAVEEDREDDGIFDGRENAPADNSSDDDELTSFRL